MNIDGTPRLFFIAWYIRDSQRHTGAPRLTDDQRAALDLVETIANDPAFHIEMVFEPGDVQLLNNTTVLHSREGYVDDEDPAAGVTCFGSGSRPPCPPRRNSCAAESPKQNKGSG